MTEVEFENEKICKYCTEKLEDCFAEGLECTICSNNVHLKCLKSGGTPGGFNGDLFFIFTCQECSPTNSEIFVRDKISWANIIVLILYHLQTKSPGLGKRGFFHWRHHIGSLIDKNWEVIFPREVKKKKKWIGTVAGSLSHFSPMLFTSGTTVINEHAWWALSYPKLTPNVMSKLYLIFMMEKQKAKLTKTPINNNVLFENILTANVNNPDLLISQLQLEPQRILEVPAYEYSEEANQSSSSAVKKKTKTDNFKKRKTLLPTLESTSRKLIKMNKKATDSLSDFTELNLKSTDYSSSKLDTNQFRNGRGEESPEIKLLDPLCHYNTSLQSISRQKGMHMRARLMGGVRQELILSPYSAIYLKPYIRRDTETVTSWLKLMVEIQIKGNKNNPNFILPPKASIDYTYVQPEHIPAINSLCNQFFWPGIDLTECLQYPDFSCVVMYKKLIIAFAFLVPNVKYTENYISFIFTRPGWRNAGIAKFMIYHLIQTSMGKDITIHVSINNPALLLYQKFGFKVERVEINFYDKYIRNDAKESKHAFFCRLER